MRKFFSLIFVCLLLAPAVVWLIDPDFGLHVKRIGLQPPRFYRQALFENEYYQSFDQYFNDSFSLRSPLILAKRWLDYRIFHMTDAVGVHVGINGWLYSRRSIEDYKKDACDDRTDIAWLALELHALEKIFLASGLRFLFFVAPNKSTIYPEFVGSIPQSESCRRSRLDLLNEAITDHPAKSFIRIDNLLRKEKNSYTFLYEKDGTYWSEAGATIAAEAIQQHIFKSTWMDQRLDYRSTSAVGSGNLNNLLMGLYSPTKDGPSGRLTFYGRSDLPHGIFYSDEFVQNLLPYVLQMFSRLDVIRADRVPSKQYKEDLRANEVILLEKAESELEKIDIDVDKFFAIFEAEAQIPVRRPLDLQTVVPVSQISLNMGQEGLEIKSVGTQSVFKLISMSASDDNIFRVLKLSIIAPHTDSMKIKYMTGLPHMAEKALKPGLKEVFLPLPFQKTISLHIHPGSKAGLFILRSAEILEFPSRLGVEEPHQEKYSIAVTDQKKEAAFPQVDSKAALTKSEHDTGISAAAEDRTVEDNNSRQVASEDEEEPTSNEFPDIPTDKEEGFAIQQAEPAEAKPQTKADAYISAPLSEDQISDSDSKMVASGDAEVTSSRNLSEEMTDTDNEDTLKPEDSEVSVLISKAETENSSAVENSANEKADTGETISEIFGVPITKAPSIAVTDFEEGRIFQRKGQSVEIVVSGKYSGKLEGIEARVVKDGTFEEVVPWTMIDASPRDGIFLGVLAEVPQGGWYSIQVRSTNNHTVSTKGTHKWGVGILVACLGQSNMKEWFYTGTALSAHSLLRKFSDKGWSELGMKGNAAIAFGNRIIERLGIPVGLLDYSINGSGLRKEADWGTGYWENTAQDSIYNRFLAGVSEAGGAVEFVVWIQGEADAARGTVTEDEYRTSLASFITNQVRADIDNGSEYEYLPFLIVMMIKRPGGKNEPHQAIRNAQKHVVENVADCYLAATTLDLKNQGRQHLAPDAYITMGRRVAQTVLFILGEETYHRGPSISSTNLVDGRTVDVRIKHRGGTNFTPAAGITGWEVLANGTLQPIEEVYQHNRQTIRIILKNPLPEKAKIRYLYGAMPDANNPVLDNSAMSLPLEEYQSVLH